MKLRTAFIATTLLTMNTAAAVAENTAATTIIEDLDRLGRVLAREKCKHPKKIDIKHIANKYENVTDEIKTFQCLSYRIVVYEAHASNVVSELPMEVTLTRTSNGLMPQLSIGTTASSVKTILGAPIFSTQESLVYSLSEERPGQDTITFHLKSGRVKSVTWSWEVD